MFSEILIEKRSSYIDHIAKKPQLPEGSTDPPSIDLGFFPILDKNILNSEANLKYVPYIVDFIIHLYKTIIMKILLRSKCK